MDRRRPLRSDEKAIWGKVARTVRAYDGRELPDAQPHDLPPTIAAALPPPVPPRTPVRKPAPVSRGAAVLADASNHKKVRRGAVEIDARLDLHGMNQEQARGALQAMVARLHATNGRCALVITGKGRTDDRIDDYYAPPPGILRRKLPDWLNDPGTRPFVAGWSPAHPKHGGGGAFYVLIKRPSRA